MAKFKQKCSKCKTNYVITSWSQRFPVCYECQKEQLHGEISDPEMKKMFDIPEEYYKDNLFLRNIKINYINYARLSDKQIDAFKKAVLKMKEEKEKASKSEKKDFPTPDENILF